MNTASEEPAPSYEPSLESVEWVPGYLVRTYKWAYLTPRSVYWLDRQWVVNTILWGQAERLISQAVGFFQPGQRVLQAACVYGDFSARLAQRLGPSGQLDVVDVAPIQIANLRRKFSRLSSSAMPQIRLRVADLAVSKNLAGAVFEGVCCFFLLHEVPWSVRQRLVHNLLAAVEPGGRIVFVDYHAPHSGHLLRGVMHTVFRTLEPFAGSLLEQDIETISPRGCDFDWHKTTVFGGLYQIVTGVRR